MGRCLVARRLQPRAAIDTPVTLTEDVGKAKPAGGGGWEGVGLVVTLYKHIRALCVLCVSCVVALLPYSSMLDFAMSSASQAVLWEAYRGALY